MPFHALLADGSSAPITVGVESTAGARTNGGPALDAVATRAVAAAAQALATRRLVADPPGCRMQVDAGGDVASLGLPLLLAYAAHALGHAHGRALPIGVAAAGGVADDGTTITAVDALDRRAQAGTLALTPGGTVVIPAAGAAALAPDVQQELEDRSLALVRVATVDDAVATIARILLGADTGAPPSTSGVGAWLRARFRR